MQFIQKTNKQVQGELTRDEVIQIINDNIVKNSDEI